MLSSCFAVLYTVLYAVLYARRLERLSSSRYMLGCFHTYLCCEAPL